MKPISRIYMRHRLGGSLPQQHAVRARNSSRFIINGLRPLRWTSTSTACHPKTALFFPGILEARSRLAMTQSTNIISQAKVSSGLAWPLPGSTLFPKHAGHFLTRWTPSSATPSPRSSPKAPIPPSQQPKTHNQLSWPHRS